MHKHRWMETQLVSEAEKANEVEPSSDSTFSGSCKDVWCISRDMHHAVDV